MELHKRGNNPAYLVLYEEDRKLSIEEIMSEALNTYFHEGAIGISVSAYFVFIPGCDKVAFESIDELRRALEKFVIK